MGKFNANSLSYSQNLPPFLAKLQGQYNADNDGSRPDPILAAQRRSVKKRSASEEAEDAPLVLDDRGDVVGGVKFGKDGTATMDEASGASERGVGGAREEGATAVDGVAAIGAGKKKKTGRVIGGGSDDEDKNKNGDSADQRKRKRPARDDDEEKAAKEAKSSKDKSADKKTTSSGGGKDKKKKKAKKIQLSFEDDEDEG